MDRQTRMPCPWDLMLLINVNQYRSSMHVRILYLTSWTKIECKVWYQATNVVQRAGLAWTRAWWQASDPNVECLFISS
jgi:hypothetical protein